MKKLVFILFISVTLLLSAFFIIVINTDFNKLAHHFLNDNLSIEKLEVKNIQVNKYLIPFITIKELNYAKTTQLKNIKVKFSLLSFFRFDPRISTIEISEAAIYSNQDNINYTNHDLLITELIKQGGLDVAINIQNIKFFEKDHDLITEINNFQLKTDDYDHKTNFSGQLSQSGNIQGYFRQNKQETKFNLDLTSIYHHISLQETYQDAILKEGKVVLVTKNIARQLSELFPDITPLVQKFNPEQDARVEFELKPTKTTLNLANIKLNSAIASGSGEVILSKVAGSPNKISLYFNQLDLATWQKKQLASQQDKLPFQTNTRLNFVKNKFQGLITIKNVQLTEQDNLKDLKLSLTTSDNHLLIKNFSGMINDINPFKLSGLIKQNKFRNLFDGNISLAHHDLNQLLTSFGQSKAKTMSVRPFNLQAQLKLSSVDFSLRQILLKLDQTTIDGNLSVKFIGKSIRTNSNISLNQANLDDGSLPLVKPIIKYLETLLVDMQETNYASKFIPIRKIDLVGSHNFKISRLIFQQREFNNVRFNLKAAPATIALEQLYFETGKNWLDLDIHLSAQTIKPILSIIVHNGAFETNLLSPTSLLVLRNKLLQDYDLDKINILTSVAFKELYGDNFSLGRIRFSAKNNGKLIEIPQIDADIFGGRMKSSGSFLLEPYNLNFVFSLNSAHLDKIATLLPPHLIPSIGTVSANGMWSTNGDNLEKQLYNLYLKSDIIAKGIKINNFAIDDFTNLISPIEYNANNLSNDVKNAILVGTTQVKRAETSIEMSQGKIALSAGKLKTKNSTASFAALIDLYQYQLEASSVFSFSLAKSQYGQRLINYTPTNIRVKATGDLKAPKKDATIIELTKFLQGRTSR